MQQHFGLVEDCKLQSWSVIGAGGFGQIYKAKHKDLGMEVAIKLLHYDDGSSVASLQKEAEYMHQGGGPYVVRVFGAYRGVPPGRRASPQLGLVMELVERGSVESLLKRLQGPPPWPLAFRLALEVALGMNFLHQLSPPLLHLDLKPSNVLLDHGFRAKITDFGLARLMRSISSVGGQEENGGTLSYMPPEAFGDDQRYKATPASDSYSYAILLSAVITGRQPYGDAWSRLIQFRVSQGDRPSLEGVDREAVEGLGEIMDLMKRCWDPSPQKRPPFHDCLPVVEKVFKLHSRGINDAIHFVSRALDEEGETSSTSSRLDCLHISSRPVPKAPVPVQETAGDSTSHSKAKGSVLHKPMRMLSADPSYPSTNQPPLAASSAREGRCQEDCDRQTAVCFRGNGSVHMSSITGLQIGNHNTMTITTSPRPRHRHSTGPARVSLPAPPPAKPFQ